MTRTKGFTLIELLLVVIIMGVLLGVAVPNFAGTFGGMELKKTANDLAYLMRFAQSKATLDRNMYQIDLAEDFKSYRLKKTVLDDEGNAAEVKNYEGRLGKTVRLPKSVVLASDVLSVHFYPDGTMDKLKMRLTSKGKSITVSTQEQRGYVFVYNEP